MTVRILFLLIVCSLNLDAQITINQGDMPQPDDIFTYSFGTSTIENPEITGENFSWDYDDLTMITQDADSFVAIGDTPFLYQFFFNNGLLYPDYQSDVALPGDDIELFAVTATNTYNYYKNDSEGYRLVGVGVTINGIPQSIQYDPIDWIYEFPLNYGDDFEGESYIEFSLPGFGFLSQDKQTETVVDGWGSLSLPIGDFDVLRVKKIINEVDSAYSEAIGLGFLIPQPQQTIYQWLAAGEIEPVLEISVSEGLITSTRYKNDLVSSIDQFSKEQISLYPNPATNFIQLTLENGIDIEQIDILDAMGRVMSCEIHSEGLRHHIDVGSLSSGYYFLQAIVKGIPHTERFVIQ